MSIDYSNNLGIGNGYFFKLIIYVLADFIAFIQTNGHIIERGVIKKPNELFCTNRIASGIAAILGIFVIFT